MTCTNSSDTYMNKYRLQVSFIPYTSDFVDEVVIPLDLIVLADGDKTKGAYTPEECENEDKTLILKWLNKAYIDNKLPSDPVPGFPSSYWLNDSKIGFEINEEIQNIFGRVESRGK